MNRAWPKPRLPHILVLSQKMLVGLPFLVIGMHALILAQYPVVGAANNLDFLRVMMPAGIEDVEDPGQIHHRFVSQHYRPGQADLTNGFSSAACIAWLAKMLTPPDHLMDIRQVGAVDLILIAMALAFALGMQANPVLCTLLLWAGLDVTYSLYFNSFFADSAALLGILALVLFCIVPHRPHKARLQILLDGLLVGAAATIGFSKQLYMVTPFVVATAILIARTGPWRVHLRERGCVVLALLATGALCTYHFCSGSGYRFTEINKHHMVFYGIAAIADDPSAALAQLGISPNYTNLVNKDFFHLNPQEKEESARALKTVSPFSVALLYARHPSMVARTVTRVWPNLTETYTADPNFQDRSRNDSNNHYSGWWQFAGIRRALMSDAVFGIPALIIIVGAIAWIMLAVIRGTCRGEHVAACMLILCQAAFTIGSILGDGFFGLVRHLMGVRCCLDLLIALVFFVTARFLYKTIRSMTWHQELNL